MTDPTKSKAIVVLKRAIADERRSARQRVKRYEALTEKMTNYQQGNGPAPTSEEFDQWRADVEARVALKLMQAGVSGLPPNALLS